MFIMFAALFQQGQHGNKHFNFENKCLFCFQIAFGGKHLWGSACFSWVWWLKSECALLVIPKTKLQNRQKEVHNYISQVVISMCNIYAQMCAARYN